MEFGIQARNVSFSYKTDSSGLYKLCAERKGEFQKLRNLEAGL